MDLQPKSDQICPTGTAAFEPRSHEYFGRPAVVLKDEIDFAMERNYSFSINQGTGTYDENSVENRAHPENEKSTDFSER